VENHNNELVNGVIRKKNLSIKIFHADFEKFGLGICKKYKFIKIILEK